MLIEIGGHLLLTHLIVDNLQQSIKNHHTLLLHLFFQSNSNPNMNFYVIKIYNKAIKFSFGVLIILKYVN